MTHFVSVNNAKIKKGSIETSLEAGKRVNTRILGQSGEASKRRGSGDRKTCSAGIL